MVMLLFSEMTPEQKELLMELIIEERSVLRAIANENGGEVDEEDAERYRILGEIAGLETEI